MFARLACALALLITAPALAQPAPGSLVLIPTSPSARESVPLGPAGGPPEQWERLFEQANIRNVVQPALYPVRPRTGHSNGRAIIVVPGGGYRFVSIESEGFAVADALAAEGYTAFVLKYRTAEVPRQAKPFMAEMGKLFETLGKVDLPDHPPAVDDLAAALRMVRDDSAKWDIDPKHIGVIGFSAGSRTIIRMIEQKPEAAFAETVALIYPPMAKPVKPGPRPPLFLAIAADDPLFVQGRLGLADAWLKESPKMEMHLYAGGAHGFGMHTTGTTSDLWMGQYLAWLKRH
jgi:acetyl esterase/lipase